MSNKIWLFYTYYAFDAYSRLQIKIFAFNRNF